MTYIQQRTWGDLIAIYLFLGGLGGAVMTLGALSDLYLRRHGDSPDDGPAIFAALFGMGALAFGTLFLLLDLLQPTKAFFALLNPKSWIFWGVLFISLYLLAGALYVLPYLARWPRLKVLAPLAGALAPWQKVSGNLAAILGLLVAIYTGFLLSSAPGIPFWNTPALPILFVLSAFSTGAALLMLYAALSRAGSSFRADILHRAERLDMGLVLAELVVIAAYFNFARFGVEAARTSASYLLHSTGFTFGFMLFGLMTPLTLEVISVGMSGLKAGPKETSGHRSISWLVALTSLLVLAGGALLRYYILKAGFYSYPWPS